MCPHCHKDAPLVYRADGVRCSACGASRSAVTTWQKKGQPQQLGGRVARGLGWSVLVSGWLAATMISWLGHWLFGNYSLAEYVGLPMMILSGMVGAMTLRAGRRLQREGEGALRQSRVDSLRALASRNGGKVTPAEAATALRLDEAQADALLTELAVAPDPDVRLEVTDQGVLEYHFGPAGLPTASPRPSRARVAGSRPSSSDDDIEELHAIVEPPVSHRAAR